MTDAEIKMKDLPIVSLKIYDPEITIDEVIGFNAYDAETQAKIVEMKRAAEDEAKFKRAVKYGSPILFKISAVNIPPFGDYLRIRTPCGHFVTIHDPNDEALEFIELAKEETVYVKTIVRPRKFGKKWTLFAEEVEFIIASCDEETAKSLINDYPPYVLLTLGYGYRPTGESYGLILPRLLPLFRPQNVALHVLSFTPPNTGKSTFANLTERLTSAYFYTETPTPANLVGDARFGTKGTAYYHRTIIFDEFDKIASLERQKLEELWKILQTGMEQGTWRRAVSSKADLSFRNTVSLLFFGNVRDETLSGYGLERFNQNHKQLMKAFIAEEYNLTSRQFVDRLCYAEYLTETPRTDDVLNVVDGEVKYLDPKVTRAIIKLIDRKTFTDFKKIVKDKAGRHANRINAFYTALHHLGFETSEQTVTALYNGNITFSSLFTKLETSESDEELTDEDLERMVAGDFACDVLNAESD